MGLKCILVPDKNIHFDVIYLHLHSAENNLTGYKIVKYLQNVYQVILNTKLTGLGINIEYNFK